MELKADSSQAAVYRQRDWLIHWLQIIMGNDSILPVPIPATVAPNAYEK